MGGTCPTVGIVGGYTQGGGHSILSSSYGVAADNVLEWEVVTVDGRHLTATPTQNADLSTGHSVAAAAAAHLELFSP